MEKNTNSQIQDSTLSSYARYLRSKPDTPKTVASTLKTLRAFLSWCQDEGIADVLAASRSDIVGWLGYLHGRYASATVALHYGQVRAFYRWLLDEELVSRNPCARIPAPEVEMRPRDVQPQPMMAAVLAMLEKEKRWRELAIISILYDCGLRVKELSTLTLANIDLDSGLVTVERQGTKTAAGVRVVRMSPLTVRHVDRYLRRRKPTPWDSWLFVGERGPLSRKRIYTLVREAFARAGAEGIVGPHDLRHTAATHMVPYMTESQMMTYFGWTSSERVRLYAKQALRGEALKAHEVASPMMRLPKKS